MSKVLVINCSKVYNLGANKLSRWLVSEGHSVRLVNENNYEKLIETHDLFKYDLIALSCIFSWDVSLAFKIVELIDSKREAWAGGSGFFALKNWWVKNTGLSCTPSIDQRFENRAGVYKMVFASRGCPVDCSFCIVPRLEGTEFKLNWDFVPAPMLCDSNLSALPVEFQEHIIKKYLETGTLLKDANSGFEPITFTEETFHRWKPVMKHSVWRFAFDTSSEEEQVRKMFNILKNIPASKKRVYVLIGNEPVQKCYDRIQKVISWGGEPHVQPMMALNALEKTPMIRYDWTKRKLIDMARWSNTWLWRNTPLWEYKPRKDNIALFSEKELKRIN